MIKIDVEKQNEADVSDGTFGSLKSFELRGNLDAESKMAGLSFNFAYEFSRKTLSRAQLTDLIQGKFEQVVNKAENYTNILRDKMDQIQHKEEELEKKYQEHVKQTNECIQDFMGKQMEELRQKGFELQNKFIERVEAAEAQIGECIKKIEINDKDIKDMILRMKTDY